MTQKILLFFLSNYGNVASEQLVYLPKNACSYKHTHTHVYVFVNMCAGRFISDIVFTDQIYGCS